jgi:hypothetical protein
VLSPSHTLLITSADKEGERKNKDKGGKRHAASPRRVLTEVVEPIVLLPCLFFLISLFFLWHALLYLFFFFAQGRTNRGNLCKRIERGAAKRKRKQRGTRRAAPHSGVRDAYSGAAVLLTSLSRQAGMQTASQEEESLSSRPAAETKKENKDDGEKKDLWRLGLGENKEKNTEISNENNDVSTPI